MVDRTLTETVSRALLVAGVGLAIAGAATVAIGTGGIGIPLLAAAASAEAASGVSLTAMTAAGAAVAAVGTVAATGGAAMMAQAQNSEGEIYRYHSDNVGTNHFSGSTGGNNPLRLDDIPVGVRRTFGRVR